MRSNKELFVKKFCWKREGDPTLTIRPYLKKGKSDVEQ